MNIRTVRFIMTAGALILAGGIVAGLLFVKAPVSNREALFLALGIVLNLPATAFGFYFGSSQGSVDKTEIIDRQTPDME